MAEKSSSSNSYSNGTENEDEETGGITMVDVLKEETELEEDANAVLGGSDPQNCTYPKGYVKRQAVYACLTCIPSTEDNAPGGMCLACSYFCHEGHELVELYTKRNFRCDCGNSLFGGNKCNLEPNKELNEKNKYNHNFRGVYCTCARPYPDPEDPVEDDMLQCIVCEDWYHGRHLGAEVPAQNNYGEMICGTCMGKHTLLWQYAGLCVTKTSSSDTNTEVDVYSTPKKTKESVSSVASLDCGSYSASNTPTTSECPTPKSDSTSPLKQDCEVCTVPTLTPASVHKGATFWPEGWRKHLCSCVACQEKYAADGIEFLTDLQDTVQFYEQEGKEKIAGGQGGSQYDQAMHALSQMDRMKQVEAIQGYNDMKDQLKDYLQKFAENRKVVREEDIRDFFSQIARKRQRVDIPTFCR